MTHRTDQIPDDDDLDKHPVVQAALSATIPAALWTLTGPAPRAPEPWKARYDGKEPEPGTLAYLAFHEPRARALLGYFERLSPDLHAASERGVYVWGFIKDLCNDLVGYGRGYVPEQARDGDQEWLRSGGLYDPTTERRIEPTTEAEKWLRTEEAWDLLTDALVYLAGVR